MWWKKPTQYSRQKEYTLENDEATIKLNDKIDIKTANWK